MENRSKLQGYVFFLEALVMAFLVTIVEFKSPVIIALDFFRQHFFCASFSYSTVMAIKPTESFIVLFYPSLSHPYSFYSTGLIQNSNSISVMVM